MTTMAMAQKQEHVCTGCEMQDDFLDTASATPRDRFLLMLLERVTAVEAALAEYDVDTVSGRVVLPEGNGESFVERASAAAQLVGEAAHAALPGLVAGVELSCTANEMRIHEACGGMLSMLNPMIHAIGSDCKNLLRSLVDEPDVTVTITLRGKRAFPFLDHALSSEFDKRSIKLVNGWGRASAGRVQHTKWVYSPDQPTTSTPKPKAAPSFPAVMGMFAAMMSNLA